jgi:hypothetical protein
MGLFDLFKGGKGTASEKDERSKPSPAAKYANAAADKRAQNYDRQEAIQALAALGTADAAAALLRRFTFHMDPSITDQEEKDAAFAGVLNAGKDAVEPVRAFAAKAESLSWAMKILKAIVSEDEYVEELVLWLTRWDTEYSKFIDPKIQLLVELEEHRHEKIKDAVAPFLEDVNETARFHAVASTIAQDDVTSLPSLLKVMADEESVRVKNKIADGVVLRGWAIPEDERDAVRKTLPSGFSIDGAGHLKKR